jgi:hypothetical protein
VKFARRRADQLSESALNGGVNVFVGGDEGKLSRRKFRSDSDQPTGNLLVFFIQQNARFVQSVRPRK